MAENHIGLQLFPGNIANIIPMSPPNKIVPLMESSGGAR